MLPFTPRNRALLVLVMASLAILSGPYNSATRPAWGQNAPNAGEAKKVAADEKTIRALITQLGDDSFDKREAAAKRLTEIGDAALGPLEKAAKDSPDFETRTRASQIIQVISVGMFAQVRRMAVMHTGPDMPYISRLVITPDGRRAISVGQDALRGWDLQTGKQVVKFDERKGKGSWGFAISADGSKVITGTHDNTVEIFDVATGKKLKSLTGHKSPVWGVAFTPDGKQALSGGDGKIIHVWDVATGQELRRFEKATQQIRCLALSPDGKLVAVGQFGGVNRPATVRLWDFNTGKEIRSLEGHTKEIACVVFSPDGKTLASTSFDSTIRLWDVGTGKEIRRLEGHTNRVEFAAFTPDGKQLLSCGNMVDPTLKLWDVASGKQLLEAERVEEGYHCVAVLPDGRECVTAGRDGWVRVWQWKK